MLYVITQLKSVVFPHTSSCFLVPFIYTLSTMIINATVLKITTRKPKHAHIKFENYACKDKQKIITETTFINYHTIEKGNFKPWKFSYVCKCNIDRGYIFIKEIVAVIVLLGVCSFGFRKRGDRERKGEYETILSSYCVNYGFVADALHDNEGLIVSAMIQNVSLTNVRSFLLEWLAIRYCKYNTKLFKI